MLEKFEICFKYMYGTTMITLFKKISMPNFVDFTNLS